MPARYAQATIKVFHSVALRSDNSLMENEAPRSLKRDAQKASNFMKCRYRNSRDRDETTFVTNEINYLTDLRADRVACAGVNLRRKDKSMITVTALALLITYLADTSILKGDKRMNALNPKQNNHNRSRRLRTWFASRRRRHDPWLVFNMTSFTFEGQPLYGFNRLAR